MQSRGQKGRGSERVRAARGENKGGKMTPTGRVFTASLKPAWTVEKMASFCKQMLGVATVFLINHDSDLDDDGNVKEVHTHIMVEYETPRKLTTVSNLLEVEPNFIEAVKSTRSMLKYLTHQDDPEKHQYSPEEVVTNSTIPYAEMIVGQGMSDREIARYLVDGRGLELLGVIPAAKLRTIQAFLQYDRSGHIQTQLERANKKLERLEVFVDNVEQIANNAVQGINQSIPQLIQAMMQIVMAIDNARLSASNNPKANP